MRYNFPVGDIASISEMAIVDTFTRLIFGDEIGTHPREELIIQAFRSVESNVLKDDYLEMGEYLRNLGVSEMIHLVSRIRQQLAEEATSVMCSAVESEAGSALDITPPGHKH